MPFQSKVLGLWSVVWLIFGICSMSVSVLGQIFPFHPFSLPFRPLSCSPLSPFPTSLFPSLPPTCIPLSFPPSSSLSVPLSPPCSVSLLFDLSHCLFLLPLLLLAYSLSYSLLFFLSSVFSCIHSIS